MDVLGQGIEILRSGVEFRSNVIYREAWVGSKEAGLTGEYGSRIGKPGDEVKATGVFHKLGDLVRVSLQWGRSSEVSSDGKKLATATSFDSVTTKRLFLNWV